ncbi:uncharacterized protein LAESUDRAFT_88674 [Laetiporus sulphureus 93-53]|uniref:F-box domain-containing protein n=1 Tax=Laetiporus sulphureus 93-53 TaxID=1314785 RepID=A0A165EXG9_9APHY|nr:uncharacterized protein LAESUDRAFT_88674 [Laetiporus sulphureus 93-53]KZT07925.1 hypothetical protein LAESUDRAFT_88674 [Laetiporus sulphureus 93-53]
MLKSSIANTDHRLSLPSPRLPTEICDYILDYLWDDHKTLKVCSRVTREWLPRTRKHLFHSVRMFSNLRRVTFEDVILHSGDAVALCIRKLVMIWDLNEEVLLFPIPASMPRMLASLGRLEELTLCVSTWDDCYFSTETITWPVLPAVKALYLQMLIVNDVVSLQQFICACPSLSSLKLEIRRASKCDSSRTHPPTVIPRSIVIETFQCDIRESGPILRWLLQGGLKLRIRRLAINVPGSIWVPVNFLRTGGAEGLLHACGECLEYLIVGLSSQISPGSLDGQQGSVLAHNPNLVSVYVLDVFWSFPSGWPSLLSILADIQPMHTRLQSIDITLLTTGESDITRMLCEQLDAALARIVETHPQLIFTVWITSNLDVPAPWLAEVVKVLLHGLVRVQVGRGRLCLMWLNGYGEIREFGRGRMPSWCSL